VVGMVVGVAFDWAAAAIKEPAALATAG